MFTKNTIKFDREIWVKPLVEFSHYKCKTLLAGILGTVVKIIFHFILILLTFLIFFFGMYLAIQTFNESFSEAAQRIRQHYWG